MILAGFTLGQIPVNSIVYKNNYTFLEESRAKSLSVLRNFTGDWLDNYFSIPKELVSKVASWPDMVNLLCLEKITEEQIVEDISKFGWRPPENVDGCSSNCQLNTFNNYIHEQVFGYNPYELELSQIIRKGLLDRETAISKVETMLPDVYARIAGELKITQNELEQAKQIYKK